MEDGSKWEPASIKTPVEDVKVPNKSTSKSTNTNTSDTPIELSDAQKKAKEELAAILKQLDDEVYAHRHTNRETEIQLLEEQAAAYLEKAKGDAVAIAEIEEWKAMKLAEIKANHNTQILESEKALDEAISELKNAGEGETEDIEGPDKYAEERRILDEHHVMVLDQMQAHYEAVLSMEGISEQQRLELKEEYAQKRAQVESTYSSRTAAIDKDSNEDMAAGKKKLYGMILAGGKDFLQQGAKQSKKMFELNKAMQISETVISTYKAAQKAHEWGLTYGGPAAPALAAAAAAAAVASGMARVASIASTSFGDDTAESSTSGSALSATKSETNLSSTNVKDTEKKGNMKITINGDVLSDEEAVLKLCSSINEAVTERNVELYATTAKHVTT